MFSSGFLIGAAFVGITAILVFRQMRATAAAEGKRCPRCGRSLLEGQLRCSRCGVPLQVYEVVTAEKLEAPDPSQQGKLHALVRADVCVGCGACVPACPEEGAIRMQGKIAIVDKSICVAHGKCVTACPVGGILMSSGDAVQRMEVPDLGADFQSNVPGLYIVGELGGRGLIKNAVNEGRLAAEAVHRAARDERPPIEDVYELAIVGSGPAGLSAALEACSLGMKYIVLEQGTLADTIRKYPRKKLLMAEPVEVPLFGNLWIADGSKEALLEIWDRLIAEQQINIRTQSQVTKVERLARGFRLHCPSGNVMARRVILALGRRGTPRKLGVPGEELGKVFYDVVEMEAFAGDRVLVVGGGDSALESAIGLSHQPNTQVTLSYRKNNFERAKERNREKLDAQVAAGRIQLLLESVVTAIGEDRVELRHCHESITLPNDTVIVRIGGEPPAAFLGDAGVQTVTRGLRLSPEPSEL